MQRQKTAIKKLKLILTKIFIIFCFISLPSFIFFRPACERYLSQSSQKTLSAKKKALIFKKGSLCLSQTSSSDKGLLILEQLLKKALQDKDSQTVKNIEKKLAQHSFYVSKDYDKALRYYTQLLKRPLGPGEQFYFQYQIADSFFQLKKPDQALLELEKCFFKGISLEQEKKAFFLKLSVLIFQKNFVLAEQLLQKKLESSQEPDLLREYLALVYESQKEFLKAIEELKKIKKASPFVEKKIKRLMERQINQPGF